MSVSWLGQDRQQPDSATDRPVSSARTKQSRETSLFFLPKKRKRQKDKTPTMNIMKKNRIAIFSVKIRSTGAYG